MSLSCTCLHVQSEFKNLVSCRVNQRPPVWLLKIKFRKSGNRRQSAGSTHFHMFSTSHLSHFVPLEYSFVSHTDLENKECATPPKTHPDIRHTHTHIVRFTSSIYERRASSSRRGSPVCLPAGRGSGTDTTRVMRLK